MRVACISHASIVARNRQAYDLLAQRHGLDLTVIVPDRWLGDLPDPDLRYAPGSGYATVLPLRAIATGNGSWFVLRGLGTALRRLRPELLLLEEEPWSLVAAQALRASSDVPFVFYSLQNIAKRLPPPFGWIRRATYRRATAAWAVGRTTADVLNATGFRKPVEVVPLGVDTARFRPGRDDERRSTLQLSGTVVGYVGRLVPEKGIGDLLVAARRLAAAVPEETFTLCLVGAGPLEQEVARVAATQPLAGRVRILGPVPHEKAAEIFRLLDVVVLPSRTTPRWREQFGRVLVEAAASGLPVVGSDSGEIPHVIGALGGGIVVPEGDGARLAEALRPLLNSAEERRRMGDVNLASVTRLFSQEAVAARMNSLLAGMRAA